jgi:hypothetical protein
MLAIQSYHFFDFDKIQFTSGNFKKNTPEISVKFAEISCPLLNKHGYETILYTSSKYIDLFKHIKYKEIILLDEEYLNRFPNDFWSIAKLISIRNINQPFIHCDLDLFLIKDISDNIKNSKFFAFHPEKWVEQKLFYEHASFLSKYFPEINKSEFMSYNLGLFGGQNFQSINKASISVLNFFIGLEKEIDHELKKIRYYHKIDSWYKTVFLEQFLMASLILSYSNIRKPEFVFISETMNSTAQDMKNHNIIHLWTDIYENVEKYIGIDNFLKMMHDTYSIEK